MSLVLLALSACTPELPTESHTWMEGAWYRWVAFNHRVSYIHVGVDDDEVDVGVVGGTSTTAQVPELDDVCDPDSCREFPVRDSAEIRVGWGRVTTDQIGMAAGTVDLVVPADGASATASFTLPPGAPEGATALIRGLVYDTNEALDGDPACYRPEYGWHPRRISAAITDVTRTGDSVEVEVTAAFAAGATEDPDRVCIDEVYTRSRVGVSVGVLVLAGANDVQEQAIATDAFYPFSGTPTDPGEQEEVPPVALDGLTIDPEATLVGWSSVDFRFNPENANERGAYLRSWGFELSEAGASGVATNFSPITQLHDMAYTFAGAVRAVTVAPEEDGVLMIDHGRVSETIPVELDDEERPVVLGFPLE